jgi:glycine/D-amino acid oxidase-like deaminating enzyme
VLSYWEQTALLDYDVIVIGGGLVGLSTACSVLERSPGLRVLVVERGTFPTGASTRNAGFACIGNASEILADVGAEGPEPTRTLVNERWLGLKRLRQRLGDNAIRYEACGGFDLLRPDQVEVLDRLGEVNDLLEPVLGFQPFRDASPTLVRFGFPRNRVAGLVECPTDGALHSGFLMCALLAHAQRLGATVLSGVDVEALEESPKGTAVWVRHAPLGERFAFRAPQVGVTTNAFTRRLLPDLDVVPGRGQVLVTEPVPGHPLTSTFHCDQGDLYFRGLGDRILLGGGRHTDVPGETTLAMETTPAIQAYLERFLAEVVLAGRRVAIEHRWAGIMAFGRARPPILQRLSPHVCVGVRMSGIGVAIGSRVGDRLADLLLAGV